MKTSLDHLPEFKQHELRMISTILRDTLDDFLQGKQTRKSSFRIHKIILFGSHAKGTWVDDPVNGYVSDYDILVMPGNLTAEEYRTIAQQDIAFADIFPMENKFHRRCFFVT